jgi:hypothetical protein
VLAAQVVVADYCPNWWPRSDLAGERRVRLEFEAGAVSADRRGPGAGHPAPDQRVLPAAELTALVATDPVFGYSFIVTNIDLPWPGTASAMITTLRHQLIRMPTRLVRHAGRSSCGCPRDELLDQVLARIRALPARY